MTQQGGEPRDSGAPHSYEEGAARVSNETEAVTPTSATADGARTARGAEEPGPAEQPGPISDMVEEGAPLEPSDLGTMDEPTAGGGQATKDVQRQLAERTADLQRLQAEYVNYKRRVDRDRDLVRANAANGVLVALLPVLDDIDRAREHGELEGGFKAVADSLIRTIEGLGLTRFGAKGDAFDPNVHEALMHGTSAEVTTTSVDVVAQAGYKVGDRVIRPAKVTVLDPA